LNQGFVFLATDDTDEVDWEELISCAIPGVGKCDGFADDQRLVAIGTQILNGQFIDLKPGTVIPVSENK
jgi:hypothetical protein